MTEKYDHAQLHRNFAQYLTDRDKGYDAYCDELWHQLENESKRGGFSTTKLMPPGNNDGLYGHIRRAFPSDKYTVSRKIAHAFQCDCNQEKGCCEWVTLVFK